MVMSVWKRWGKRYKHRSSLEKWLVYSSFPPLFFVTPCLWFRFVYSYYTKYCTGNRTSPSPPPFFLFSFLTWQMPFPHVCLSYLVHNVLWRTWIKPKSNSVYVTEMWDFIHKLSHRLCLLASYYFQYVLLSIFIMFIKVSAIYLVH